VYIIKNDLDRIREQHLPDRMIADGIDLKRISPASYKGRCPFHEDRDPSLHVNLKGRSWLWHCFGCDAGGDILKYVMQKHSLTFNEAVQRLLLNRKTNGSSASKRGTLEVLADHYHKTLLENKKAQEYLASRGLWDPSLIREHRIGFSDGTLPRDSDLLSELKALGIIYEKGGEFFRHCIVFPIGDKDGRTVSFYGRSVKRPGHLYLKGPHKGIFNQRSVLEAKQITLTESIMDALSLIKLGLKDTIALYGTQGFTDEHYDLLSMPQVEEIILALDNDPSGRRCRKSLLDKLPGAVPKISSLRIPDGMKDPNDYLLSGGTLEDLLKTKEELKRDGTLFEDVFGIEEAENEVRLKRPDRSYRVRGLAAGRLDSMKVTLRIQSNKGYHLDSLDLYSQKMRQNFARHCQRALNIEENEVQRDLKHMIDCLEKIQIRMLDKRRKAGKQEYIMNGLERKEALDYLKDPHLIGRIITDAKMTGHVGEENSFLLAYLVAISRKLKSPLGLLIIAQSGAGKSALQDRVCAFCPSEDVVKLTRLTDQSLFYQDKEALKHKLLTIEEEEGAQGAGYSIRHLLNANGLVSLSTARDESSGRNRSISHEVEGPTSMMLTTTHSEINYETYNRFVILTANESRSQTRAILIMQRRLETLDGVIEKRKNERIYRLHQNLQRLLRPLEIVNPLAEKLIFTDSFLRARREQVKYLTLIKAVALLRQHQKEIKTGYDGTGAFEYIEADATDVRIANGLAQDIFTASMDDATPQTRKFLDLINRMISALESQSQQNRLDLAVSRRQIREYTGWSDYQVRKHIEELVGLEYLIPVSGSKGKRFCYALAWDPQSAQNRQIMLRAVDNL